MLLSGKTFGILRKSITKRYPYFKQFKLAGGGSIFQKTVNLKSAAIKKVMESKEPVPKSFMKLLVMLPETVTPTAYLESIKRSVYGIPDADKKVKEECTELLAWLTRYFDRKGESKNVLPTEKPKEAASKSSEGIVKLQVRNYSDSSLMIKFRDGILEIREVESERLKNLPKLALKKEYQFVAAGYNDTYMGREEEESRI